MRRFPSTRMLLLLAATSACAADPGSDDPGGGGGKGDDLNGCGPLDGLIGGETASPGQFPATAGLRVQPPGASGFGLTCTMTKVAERAFLTAAHCMFPGGEQDGGAPIRPELEIGAEIEIVSGVFQPGQELPDGHPPSVVTATRVAAHPIHPSWFEPIELPVVDGKIVATDGDAALLVVTHDTPHIAIARVRREPVEACAPVVMHGYGCDTFDFGTALELRFLDARVEDTLGSMLYISSALTDAPEEGSICPGDSGGALLAADGEHLTIVGVNSRFLSGQVLGQQLEPNQSYFTRLDDEGPVAMATWLADQLAALE